MKKWKMRGDEKNDRSEKEWKWEMVKRKYGRKVKMKKVRRLKNRLEKKPWRTIEIGNERKIRE